MVSEVKGKGREWKRRGERKGSGVEEGKRDPCKV